MRGREWKRAWFAGVIASVTVAACDRPPTAARTSPLQASTSAEAAVPCPVAGGCEGGSGALRRGTNALSTTWDLGDVYAGVSSGSYGVYSNGGTFKEVLSDGLGGFTTGCSFDPPRLKLYTTNFSSSRVVVWDDASPHPILTVINSAADGGGSAESIAFDTLGNFYVGHAGGSRQIHKYDAAGTLLARYTVATERVGSDWIELAADQKTIYYTSEGARVMAYDVSTGTQLTDFANVGGTSYALRLLPPGDGSNGMLVAHQTDIVRLDASGVVVQGYDVAGADSWFALNLDPNGTSFWSGDINTGDFYRFNIATGAVEIGPVDAAGANSLYGLCVKGEPTGAVPPPSGFEIDIEPEDPANVVSLGGLRLVVAVKSSPTIDATTIDPATCRIKGDNEAQRPMLALTRLIDVDKDGDQDLVLFFNLQTLVLSGNLTTATTSMIVRCGTQSDSDVVAPI